ncbi:hypothetical protein RAB80_016671 [Fusarium oxysporum f. sp. vasinfectum]|uniref:Uncharacterized protein n=1 Tax=Fusarium oxysporum f. sp. vasinfectum 25433 TaxID=1089449 RepID=X0MLG4_FUSOX|nr:hypothetical protein FOTG_10902 [Fusarium oxysporum f. sp. vasinfectum 25433]KAK2667480.1 hypothetical protein RAB80_016671 [Fusarium oxysporum f. sp. vasinfectum]KAK2924523.1 hypothetical protein FoTM2_014801 [Fusarium oxysporum f. sp. vasinfectum]
MEAGYIVCYISVLILAYIGNSYERLFHALPDPETDDEDWDSDGIYDDESDDEGYSSATP